jgi:hypothetical protein
VNFPNKKLAEEKAKRLSPKKGSLFLCGRVWLDGKIRDRRRYADLSFFR